MTKEYSCHMWVILQSFLNVYFNKCVIVITQLNYIFPMVATKGNMLKDLIQHSMPLAASIHIYFGFVLFLSLYFTDGQNLSCFSLLLSCGQVCLYPSYMSCWCWCQTECSHMHIWKIYAGIILEYPNMTTTRKFISVQLTGCTLIWHSSWSLIAILNSADNFFKSLLEYNSIFLCRLAQGQ